MVRNVHVDCVACPIRHRAVCARADEQELAYLESIKTYRTYAAGEQIMWRGDPLAFVSTVVSGVATLGRSLEDGRTQVVGLLLRSDFIGRPGRQVVDYDVVAVTDTTLCCFERRAFEKIVHRSPHISERLMEMALDELDAARDWMMLLGRKSAREKIATFLSMLVRRSNTPGRVDATQIALPLTREEIADFLGLTLETVSRQMNALKNEGVIGFSDRRHFLVADPAALSGATGDDR